MKKIITLLALIFQCYCLYANHIVGGVMYYECLGNNRYRITLDIYRDGNPTGQRASRTFDRAATFGVYRGTTEVEFRDILMLPDSFGTRVPVTLDRPCVTPPDIDVRRGKYTFEVTLPFSNEGYTIVYQRCCRNNSISNIQNPGNTGATFSIFISPFALTSCDNSPVFSNTPPIAICNQVPLNFDHSATDREGNRIEYTFCEPQIGGTSTSPKVPAPLPPPYSPVTYISPFSAGNPLLGNPVVTIDPQTGRITGTPNIIGQFVVSVCATSYDANGNILTIVRRDFQFNVTNCTVNVLADIANSSVLNAQQRLFRSCGDTTQITFQNTSRDTRLINGYLWTFNMGPGNPAIVTRVTNPTVSFPGYGRYTAKLVANPDNNGCKDSTEIVIDVFPRLNANFSYLYDSCSQDSIRFTDLSSSNGGFPVNRWRWNFGNSVINNLQNPKYKYPLSNNYNVSLLATDVNGCTAVAIKPISYFPASTPNVSITPSTGCEPLLVNYNNRSSPINGYSVSWDFGNNTSSTLTSPTATYNEGIWQARLRIVSPIGCVTDTLLPPVQAVRKPTALFSITRPDSCVAETILFGNLSTNTNGATITSNAWSFGDNETANTFDASHFYTTPGVFPVNLSVTDSNGCTASTVQTIRYFPASIILFDVDTFGGCEPFRVRYNNRSIPVTDYNVLWEFGDGQSSNDLSPVHIFPDGRFVTTLTITSPIGCVSDSVLTRPIVVLPNATAGFVYTPTQPTSFEPAVRFNDRSREAVLLSWDFGRDEGRSVLRNPLHIFQDTGLYTVRQIASHPSGCADTAYRTIDVIPLYTYFLPNAFTPNFDNINDGFRGGGEMKYVLDFEMVIYNRWGERIFTTNQPYTPWNGRRDNDGPLCESGVYVVTVKFREPRGESKKLKGFVTLVE